MELQYRNPYSINDKKKKKAQIDQIKTYNEETLNSLGVEKGIFSPYPTGQPNKMVIKEDNQKNIQVFR
jgi:hypothetical protein